MKKHAIIPIFIPHRGCPHDCVFCNQRKITARSGDIGPKDAEKTIEDYLSTLEGRGLESIEVAFFGGSFTGIPMEEQSAFLEVAKRYKDAGKINAIHLSTRPDYINREILDNLKKYGVDVIELGVQSFDPEVLRLSKRGHSAEDVAAACGLIHEYGFTLGIQLMVGLPGDSKEACIDSAKKAVALRPEIARIYPTVVIDGTELAEMYRAGAYRALTTEEAVDISKEMYKILVKAGVNVIRGGLKNTDIINDGESSAVLADYHPSFRQLMESEIAREETEAAIRRLFPDGEPESGAELRCYAAPRLVSALSGYRGRNRRDLARRYPALHPVYLPDASLGDCEFRFEPDAAGLGLQP